MGAKVVDGKWEQGVCDGCGYVEESYDAGEFSAVEGSELGHYLGGDWLWTYGDPIDLCPKCSIECASCDGQGCEECGYHGRKAVIGVRSRIDYPPESDTEDGNGNRTTASGVTRFGDRPIYDVSFAALELSDLGGAEPRLGLLIADARSLAGIIGLQTTVEAVITRVQVTEVRARLDAWLARHPSTPAEVTNPG